MACAGSWTAPAAERARRDSPHGPHQTGRPFDLRVPAHLLDHGDLRRIGSLGPGECEPAEPVDRDRDLNPELVGSDQGGEPGLGIYQLAFINEFLLDHRVEGCVDPGPLELKPGLFQRAFGCLQ